MKQMLRASAAAALLLVCASTAQTGLANEMSSISGQVVDARTHMPIGGVKIAMYANEAGSDAKMLAAALSSKNGSFRLDRIVGGQYRLELTKMGYEVQILSGISVRAQEHTIVGVPIAMHAASQTYMTKMACNQLVRPDEVSDVYVVCAGR